MINIYYLCNVVVTFLLVYILFAFACEKDDVFLCSGQHMNQQLAKSQF